MLCEKILNFYSELYFDTCDSIHNIKVLNPYIEPNTFAICEEFYTKYYSDNNARAFIFGINPGRLGGGLTGIPFTDPINLYEFCGIENDLPKKHELSSQFIYKVIEKFGDDFFSNFFVTSVCPLGLVKDGKNINYYDFKEFTPFIKNTFNKQIEINPSSRCICIGEGENYKYLKKLNQEFQFFEEIIPLPHPRFIMQYRRKKIDEYINQYLEAFKKILS